MGVNSVLLNSLGTLWRNNVESDDSEDDDMLPTEEYWALPDDGWTLVEKPHAKSRGVKFKTGTSYDALDSRVIEERNYYDALDDIVDDSVLLNYQRKQIRNTNTLVEVSSTSEVVSMDVTPPMYVQPDRLVRGPRNDVETVPLVVAEAVTPRVSALPTVGSDFQTGLSTAVGREDRSLGSILDKVDHVAGQLRVRTVPVEDLLFFSAVYFVMPHVLRSLTVRTSTFFLSDGRGELPLPINVRDDRPVRIRRLYAQEMDMRAQMTKEIHGVGPNGDRWDGIDVSDEWYMGRGWVKPQPGDRARVLQGNTFPEFSGLESGPAVRTGPFVLDVDWRNGHPNRGDWLLVTIKGALIPDGPFGHLPALWQYTWVCYYIFSFLAARLEMSSASFLKSISESDYDRLYDLPAGIPDVMGLQALRPSVAVCKVMSIPDSNCVRVITPDEHVPTGFHQILIEDMGLREWPKVTLSEIGCLRLDWPQEFFTFVGRYQLELEQMRKECRDRFEGISSGACPTCEKFIQNNLGRHVAMYHLDLAQLWRCPVGWFIDIFSAQYHTAQHCLALDYNDIHW